MWLHIFLTVSSFFFFVFFLRRWFFSSNPWLMLFHPILFQPLQDFTKNMNVNIFHHTLSFQWTKFIPILYHFSSTYPHSSWYPNRCVCLKRVNPLETGEWSAKRMSCVTVENFDSCGMEVENFIAWWLDQWSTGMKDFPCFSYHRYLPSFLEASTKVPLKWTDVLPFNLISA